MDNDAKYIGLNYRRTGIAYGMLSYGCWGLLPIYWKFLDAVPAMEILAHRILWSFFFMAFLLMMTNKKKEFIEVILDWKRLKYIIISSILITVNWFLYIWAVNSGRIVETSLGYYITPLVSFLLGVMVFREKLDAKQYIALFLAAVGVAIVAFQYDKVPYLSLALALSFGLYGLMKKVSGVESSISLAVETALIVPAAAAYILFRQINGVGAIGNLSPVSTLLILCAGAVTAIPLLLFSESAKRLELSTLGFLQFISPTISLFLGVLVYGEVFTKTHMLSFSFIWTALIIYCISLTAPTKKLSENTSKS